MPARPEIVCICGSMPTEIDTPITVEQKAALCELHLRRIDLADWVEVVNRGEHFGESTLRESAYAEAAGKPITFVGVSQGAQLSSYLSTSPASCFEEATNIGIGLAEVRALAWQDRSRHQGLELTKPSRQ